MHFVCFLHIKLDDGEKKEDAFSFQHQRDWIM